MIFVLLVAVFCGLVGCGGQSNPAGSFFAGASSTVVAQFQMGQIGEISRRSMEARLVLIKPDGEIGADSLIFPWQNGSKKEATFASLPAGSYFLLTKMVVGGVVVSCDTSLYSVAVSGENDTFAFVPFCLSLVYSELSLRLSCLEPGDIVRLKSFRVDVDGLVLSQDSIFMEISREAEVAVMPLFSPEKSSLYQVEVEITRARNGEVFSGRSGTFELVNGLGGSLPEIVLKNSEGVFFAQVQMVALDVTVSL